MTEPGFALNTAHLKRPRLEPNHTAGSKHATNLSRRTLPELATLLLAEKPSPSTPAPCALLLQQSFAWAPQQSFVTIVTPATLCEAGQRVTQPQLHPQNP